MQSPGAGSHEQINEADDSGDQMDKEVPVGQLVSLALIDGRPVEHREKDLWGGAEGAKGPAGLVEKREGPGNGVK